MTLLQKIEKGGLLTKLKSRFAFVQIEIRDGGSIHVFLERYRPLKNSCLDPDLELKCLFGKHGLSFLYCSENLHIRLEHAK